jgi:alpha-aminoadipic semialdehyde synthase
MKNHTIAIRHEDKYLMERRTAITPSHVKNLIDKGFKVLVESSDKRVFKNGEYAEAGAEITTDLSLAPVIFGLKEMPNHFFEPHKTYVFFSHTIKGQPYNMPMLRKMMEKKANLIDYEKIADDQNRRLIFFGRFAGLAGMINSLWSFGMRMRELGHETPFTRLKQAHHYYSLDEAKAAVKEVGHIIQDQGFHKTLNPFIIGVTGYGNVAKGAQEIIDLLPVKEVYPDELENLCGQGDLYSNVIYKVTFKESHISRHKESNEPFDLQHYYQHPDAYENQFDRYFPYLTILMNCMYWDTRYPKIVTRNYLEMLSNQGEIKVKVIGDVTCDPNGSVEITHKGTDIEDPVFVYNPRTGVPTMGFKGDGILVMAVDILPSELPRDSSIAFANALYEFVAPIAQCDFRNSFESLELPAPIKRALILHRGEFTPDYKYMEDFIK